MTTIATTNATTTNATATTTMNATNATAAGGGPIITNLTWYEDANFNFMNPSANGPPNYVDRVEPLSAANIQYRQTDPAFAKLAQTTYDCLTHYNEITKKIIANPQFRENPGSGVAYTAEDIRRQDLCTDTITQGINHFCESTDFATFDMAKCEEARKMSETYVGVAEVLYG